MTLKALGKETGLSHGFLSQVERGRANPSFLTLADISRALGVSPSVLVAQTPNGLAALIRNDDRTVSYGVPGVDGVVARSLSPADGLIKAIVSEGSFELREQMAHPGEEFLYVIAGELEVTIEDERFTLGPGDALTFDCSRPHAYRTLNGTAPHLLVAVVDPGAYGDGFRETLQARGLTTRS